MVVWCWNERCLCEGYEWVLGVCVCVVGCGYQKKERGEGESVWERRVCKDGGVDKVVGLVIFLVLIKSEGLDRLLFTQRRW